MYSIDANLVSVIIPTYNSAKFLPHAIESVRSQTYRPLEVLIIDDGSLDNTAKIINQIKERYNCNDFLLRYFHQENKGISAARNLGISKSRGKYIQLLDSDDLLTPKKIELQVRMLQDSGCDVAYGPWRKIYDYGLLRYGPIKQKTGNPSENFILQGQLSGIWWVPPHSYLFSRNVILKTGEFDETICVYADLEFFLRILIRGASFQYVPGSHVLYRRHAGGNVSYIRLYDSSHCQHHVINDLKVRSKVYLLLKEENRVGNYYGKFERWCRNTVVKSLLHKP